MGKIDARLIPVNTLFAPVILEGQQIVCYVGEEITPYSIQCDNVVPDNSQATVFDNTDLLVTLTKNIGTLTSLTTNAKTSLVEAINEINTKSDGNDTSFNIGDLSSLDTEDKTSIVNAINEVYGNADTNSKHIGNLDSLTTNAKSSIVQAINEVNNNSGSGDTSDIGSLSSLNTDVKSSIVEAINEIYSFVKVFKEENVISLHNSIYRGKYLGSTFTDAQSEAIRAGTFDDLWLGDYWIINSIYWRIVDFDYFFYIGSNNGNTGIKIHHAVIVPDYLADNYAAKMNDTATTQGGYAGSKMHTENLEPVKSLITNIFGSEHILTHREYLTNTVKDGKPSNATWYDVTVALMSEVMFYGKKIISTSDAKTSDKLQFSAFRYSRDLFRKGTSLRDVVNDTKFCSYSGNGFATSGEANYTGYIRPYFLLY